MTLIFLLCGGVINRLIVRIGYVCLLFKFRNTEDVPISRDLVLQTFNATSDARYNRGATLRLKLFLNDGVPQPKIVGETGIICFRDSRYRCVPRSWGFHLVAVLLFYKSVLGEILSSQIEEPPKKSGAPLL